MPAMRIYEIARTPGGPEEIEAATKRFLLAGQYSRYLWSGGACLVGSGLITAAFFLVQHDKPAMNGAGALAGLVGLCSLVLGLVWLAPVPLGCPEMRRAIAADMSRTSDVVVEIEAVRITAAEPLDDDANAIILHDGHGQGVYINSHRLFELDARSEGDAGLGKYPSEWRLTLTARVGAITDIQASGPVMEVEGVGGDEVAGLSSRDLDWAEAVVLDLHTPGHWRSLAGAVSGYAQHRAGGQRGV